MDHTNNSCCCGEAEYFSGCLICGAPITYRAEKLYSDVQHLP